MKVALRSRRWPLAASLGALSIAAFVPFTQIWLYANFYLKKNAREQVIERVKSGEYGPNMAQNAGVIALPADNNVSSGGNVIVVQGNRSNPYVFFFTFHGILDNYSGFLWVPTGGKPQEFQDADEIGTEVEHFGGNWYFIGHS